MNASLDECPNSPALEGSAGWLHAAWRFAPAAGLAVVAVAAWRLGVLHQLTALVRGEEQSTLRAAVEHTPVLAWIAYVAVFAALTAACLPVALILTLTGGILFGPTAGGAGTVVGATSAAVLTYLAARTALAPALMNQAKRDPRLAKVMQGFGKDAFSYILAMRLIPLFPFSLVNIAAGLAAAPLRAYAAATALGAIPTSFIYSNLGAGLGRGMADERSITAMMTSPSVVLPLVCLGLLSFAPIAIKAVKRLRERS